MNAARVLLAGCVAVALSMGMSGTAGAASAARAASNSSDSSARAAGECATQKAKVHQAKKAVKKADRKVERAKKATKQADTAKQQKKAKKRLAHAKHQRKKAKKTLERARKNLRKCQRQSGGADGQTPEEQCLAAGLPAEVCSALGQLPLPPSPGGTSPIQALCDQGLPQAICDAATLPSPDGEASPIQPLCEAGLPQEICDAAAPGGGGSPLPPELCTLPIPLPLCELPLPLRAAARAA